MSNQLRGSNGPLFVRDEVGGIGAQIRGQLVFPATVNAADPAALTDLLCAQLSVDTNGRLRVITTFVAGQTFPSVPSIIDETVENAARAVAPIAGAAIVTLVAPPAGTYEVVISAKYDAGAPAAAELNNMEVQRGGVPLFSPLQVASVLNHHAPFTFRIAFSGANNLSINAIAAGTAGVGYSGAIIATRIA